ncbi:MAG: hypothetical protein HFH08_06230 [Bacilli bacterium]|nr:hypothetical protein [Bacilli bacterium]
MNYIPIKEYNLKILRALALQKPLIEREQFYLSAKDNIVKSLSKIKIMTLSRMIFEETEPYLQELECYVLGEQLANYIGPITTDYLDAILDIFPVSSIWHLAMNAKFLLIKEKARTKLNSLLDQYGYEIKEEDRKEKRKENERNKK